MEHIKRVMHGESKTRLYRIWSNLKNRVLPNSVKAKYYFDKGIGLCDEWKNSFISFRDWSINNGYDDKLTIDRIDNNLGYSSENCRWVDMKVQANNRSNNITVYADKACVPFSDVCRILGVDYKTAYDKIIMNLVANKNSSNIGKGEQKPADKDEPKFNIGDLITNGIIIGKVDENDNNKYHGWFGYDKDLSVHYADIPDVENWHLWTIQDAKDGDVLSYVTDEEDLWIMIYRSSYEPYEGHVHYHALLVNDNFSDKGTCCICIDDLKPATKEQRNTLLKTMTDAGYTFDFEKKELKKIEQKPQRMVSAEAKEALYDKPAWSEEDKTVLDNLIYSLANDRIGNNRDEYVDWLKSLKDRVLPQPKQEWSEEDAKALNRISTILVDASEVKNWWKEYRLIERDEMIRLTDFLKSLKPLRSTQ